jgi:hypothetical protein
MHNKLYIASPAERDIITPILAHNNYTVRQGREKQGNKSVSFVEYWSRRESQAGIANKEEI